MAGGAAAVTHARVSQVTITGAFSLAAPLAPIIQAQLAFQGVRRLPRIGPAIDDTCDYDERTFTYPLSGVISAPGPATSPSLTLTQTINDYDFDLYQLMFFYQAAGTPIPASVCTAWVYDYARNAISNIPVLDSILNGAPGSKYKNGAILPRLRYRQSTTFRIDLFNQTSISPLNVTVLLVGRQRYPKGPQ